MTRVELTQLQHQGWRYDPDSQGQSDLRAGLFPRPKPGHCARVGPGMPAAFLWEGAFSLSGVGNLGGKGPGAAGELSSWWQGAAQEES